MEQNIEQNIEQRKESVQIVKNNTIDIESLGIQRKTQVKSTSILKCILQNTFPCGYILSSDKRPPPTNICIQMQEKLGIRVYYLGEWHTLIQWFNNNIIYQINSDNLEIEDKKLWSIIYRICNYNVYTTNYTNLLYHPQNLYNNFDYYKF